mmetsp:Transcript_28396/g.62411  ORF Transcript_28396/g.62411 Transcript_28396/m.62411 type:complete len:214 (-) Transcript_28396:1040-1681(-)
MPRHPSTTAVLPIAQCLACALLHASGGLSFNFQMSGDTPGGLAAGRTLRRSHAQAVTHSGGHSLCLHHADELLKADISVMGPGGGLGVVLDGHGLLLLVHHACACAVIQVDVGHLHTSWQSLGVHCEVVVLGADLNAARGVVADGVVAAVVSELELEGLAAKGLPQDLVAHADAKHRLLAQDLLGVVDGVGGSGGVTGAVAEEDAIWVHLEHL